MITIPLNQKIIVPVIPNRISPEGEHLIKRRLEIAAVNKRDVDYKLLLDHSTDLEDLEWVWQTERGTFPKRLRTKLEARGWIISDDAVAIIGNLARKYSLSAGKYVIDFVDKFNWGRYEFGQRNGSCFYGDRPQVLDLLREAGILAMRVYGDDDIGIARAWLWRDDNIAMLFNAYGLNLTTMAQIFQQWSKWPTCGRVDLTNNGETDELVWINQGIGYAITEYEDDLPDEVDLEIEVPDAILCHFCETHIAGDRVCEYADCLMCEFCYDERVGRCDTCDDPCWIDDLHMVERDDVYVCDDCLRRKYVRCDVCKMHTAIDDIYMDDNSHRGLCPDCHEKQQEKANENHPTLQFKD